MVPLKPLIYLLYYIDAGPSLRKDDPGSLKEIVLLVLERAKQIELDITNNTHTSTTPKLNRMRFMVETITELKHNKMKASSSSDIISQMKKSMKAIVGKRGNFYSHFIGQYK